MMRFALLLSIATTLVLTTKTQAFVATSPPNRQLGVTLRVASLDPFDVLQDKMTWTEYDNNKKNNNNNKKNNNQNNNKNGDMVEQLPLLAIQFVVVLAIKAAKDAIYYPPLWIQQALSSLGDNHNDDYAYDTAQAVDILNPVVLVAKFVGLLLFKSMHDVVYYPTLWAQRYSTCQSLEECPLGE